jgi:hypothetical protein
MGTKDGKQEVLEVSFDSIFGEDSLQIKEEKIEKQIDNDELYQDLEDETSLFGTAIIKTVVEQIEENEYGLEMKLEQAEKDVEEENEKKTNYDLERPNREDETEYNIPTFITDESVSQVIKEWFETGEHVVIADKMFNLAAAGALRKQIKKALRVGNKVWKQMMNLEDPIFYNAIIDGEEIGTEAVVDSLKSLATGYDYIEYKKGVRNGKPFHEVHKRHKPAEFSAINKYLNNKGRKEWAEDNKGNVNLNVQNNINLKELPPEMLQMLLEADKDKNKERDVVSVQ